MQGHENEDLIPKKEGEGESRVEGGIIGENEETEVRDTVAAEGEKLEVKDGFGGESKVDRESPEGEANSESEEKTEEQVQVEGKELIGEKAEEKEQKTKDLEKESGTEERKIRGLGELKMQARTLERAESRTQAGATERTERRADKKGLIVALAIVCLVVIGAGVGVWIWRNRGNEKGIETGEIETRRGRDERGVQTDPEVEAAAEEAFEEVNTGMSGDNTERVKAMAKAYSEAVDGVGEIAYENGGWKVENGEDVYDYDIIEKNINEYLDEIEDKAKRNQAAAFAISKLSNIGDTEGAERIIDSLNTEEFSDIEWYCYYQGIADYYLAIGDEENYKKYRVEYLKITMEAE